MRILSITAQKPDSTGSGVYLSELVKEFYKSGQDQAVVAGIYREDRPSFPERTAFYPVYFQSGELPFPIAGMSDEMPYPSTRYCDLTEEMTEQFRETFLRTIRQAVSQFEPDLILCHHLYLLTAIVREAFPGRPIYGFCHNTDLRQMLKTNLLRNYIKEQIRELDRVYVPQEAQRRGVMEIYGIKENKIFKTGMGYNREIFRPIHGLRKKDGVIRLVFAGKIAEKKGVISLIKCLSHLPYPREKLVLKLAGGAGNREEYEEIRRLAHVAPYPVEFLGKLSQPELAQVYNECDVFVLPSFFDGIPLTVIEALACGDRVVMTELPGIQKWLSKTAPGASVLYVKMPGMRNTDEPVSETLPAFERELAEKLRQSIEAADCPAPDLRKASWENICERILETS